MSTANKYDYILHMFTENDRYTLRPILLEVNKSGEHVYATNAYVLIKMPASLPGIQYTTNEEYPDAESIVLNSRSESVTVTRNYLMKFLSAAKLKWKMEDGICTKCKGRKTLNCRHCDSDYDCPDCEGEGKNELEAPYADFKAEGKDIEFLGFIFSPHLLNKLTLVLFILDIKEIQMRYTKGTPARGVLFELPENINIILMPKLEEE